MAQDPPTLTIGSRFGRYRIDGFIGRGAMGVVMRAQDVELGRPVALKLLDPDLVDDPQARASIREESRLAASLDHPAILPIYEVGLDARPPFIAMRYVGGRDLARLLRDDAPLDLRTTVRICSQVAAALDASHARDLLHGDVKPANILIEHGPELVTYLADFGLSRRMTGTSAARQRLETNGLVAPEVLSGGVVDRRSDQYALAGIMESCLTGFPPRSGSTAPSDASPDGPPDSLPTLEREPQHVPETVRRAIERGRAVDPRDRYPDCMSLVQAVVAAGLGGDAPDDREVGAVRQPAIDERAPRAATDRARHRRRIAITVMVMLALGVTLWVGIVARPWDARTPPVDAVRAWQDAWIARAEEATYAAGWQECLPADLLADRSCPPASMACVPQDAGIQLELGGSVAAMKCPFSRDQPVLNVFLFEFVTETAARMWWSYDALFTGKVGPSEEACREGHQGTATWVSGRHRGVVACWFQPSGRSGLWHWWISWHQDGSSHTGLLSGPAMDPASADAASGLQALDGLWRSLPHPLGIGVDPAPAPSAGD